MVLDMVRHKEEMVRFFPFTAADTDFIRSLSKKVFEHYGPYESILTQWLESGIALTLVAWTGRKPVGFAMLQGFDHKWPVLRLTELLAIAVEPERRRIGIGDLLMDEIVREAERLKSRTLVLHTATDNLPAQMLFRKHGFSELGMKKDFYPKGQDAIIMYKEIF